MATFEKHVPQIKITPELLQLFTGQIDEGKLTKSGAFRHKNQGRTLTFTGKWAGLLRHDMPVAAWDGEAYQPIKAVGVPLFNRALITCEIAVEIKKMKIV